MSPLRVIATTPTKGLKPAIFLNQPVHQHYINLQAVLGKIEEQTGAPGSLRHLFAKPVIEGLDLSQAQQLGWMTDLPGEPVPFPALPAAQQQEVGTQIRKAYAHLQEFVATCHGRPGKEGQYAEFLRLIAVPSDPACLFVIDGKPVITNWGFLPEGAHDPATTIFVGWDDLTSRLPRPPTSVAPTPPPRAAPRPPAPPPGESSSWGKWLLLALLVAGLLAWLFWPRGQRPTSPVVTDLAEDSDADTDETGQPATMTAGIDPGARGNISFTLVWTHINSSRPGGPDIDLQVLDPKGNLLSTSNIGARLGPTPEGGRIDRDDRGGWGRPPSPGGGPERAYWPDGQAPLGTYTYGVCYYRGDGDVDYTLRVYDRDRLVVEKRGKLTPADEGSLLEVGQVVLGDTVTALTGQTATALATAGTTAPPGGQTSSQRSTTTSTSGDTPGGGVTSSWSSSRSNVRVIDEPPTQHAFSRVSSSTWVDTRAGRPVVRLASEAYASEEQESATTPPPGGSESGPSASPATTAATGTGAPQVGTATDELPPEQVKRFSLIMDSEGSYLDQFLQSEPIHPETTWDLQDPQGQTFVSDKAFFKDAAEKSRVTGPTAVLRLIGPPPERPYEVKVAYTNPAGTRVFYFSVTTRRRE